jgi:iron complex transport system substrate-binding protein
MVPQPRLAGRGFDFRTHPYNGAHQAVLRPQRVPERILAMLPDKEGQQTSYFSGFPGRIVCLTEETVETLYLLGEERRIAGVSGYAVRPPRVRREKPRVSAFISADVPKILALDPDLVLTFSDLQADIAAELIRHGIAVHAFNQRDITGIFAMIRTLGALVGAAAKADELAASLERAARLPRQPRV